MIFLVGKRGHQFFLLVHSSTDNSSLSIFLFRHVEWNSALVAKGLLKLVPSAIPIHSYLYWIDIEWMNKWHWTSPRQIKVEKTVIYSFSLFENVTITK